MKYGKVDFLVIKEEKRREKRKKKKREEKRKYNLSIFLETKKEKLMK